GRTGVSWKLHGSRCGQRALFHPGVASRPFPVRSAGLHRFSTAAARACGSRARGARHGGERGSVLQLSPGLSARRRGLRPRPCGHYADGLRRGALSRAVRRLLRIRRAGHLRDDVMKLLLRGRCAAIAIIVLSAACQPLPHPFADDRPSASLLRIPDSAGISVAPIEGGPPDAARKLGAAVASALVKREIPASDKTTSLTSYLLYGRLETQRPRSRQQTVTAHWRLQDAAGHLVGERTTRLDAPAKDWDKGDEKLVAGLAEKSAAEIAPLLAEGTSASADVKAAAGKNETAAPDKTEAAAAKNEDNGRTRIVIRPVSGAPGDGAKSLANAIALVLKRQDLKVLEDANAKADVI